MHTLFFQRAILPAHHCLLDLGKRIILQSPNFLKCKIKEGLHSVIHMSVPLQIIHPSPGILLCD